MRNLVYVFAGAWFGFVLYKSEVISWYRIHEMFRFQSFHMYGIIFSAVAVAAISLFLIRKLGIEDSKGKAVSIVPKELNKGTWIGGAMFGMGWALTGACPGPLYIHLGAGTWIMIVTIASALLGTATYSVLRSRLPH